MNLCQPIIAICGTTGVGKSKLAIKLALHLSKGCPPWTGAKVINADSMQVYQGMDIITNKVPVPEREGVEHLLMDFKQPGEQYIIGEWIQDVLKAIDQMHKRNEIPIVVGGTSYWIQHLLFPGRLVSESKPRTPQPGCSTDNAVGPSDALANAISSLDPHLLLLYNQLPLQPPAASKDPVAAFQMYTLLSKLDPVVAGRWHWRDTRKVHRSLQIIKEAGRTTSEVLAEQTNEGIQVPRFRTLCFWLYSEPSTLAGRLDERVDSMIQQGLLNEIQTLRQIASSPRTPEHIESTLDSLPPPDTDYTLGIYQSIGYKEFHDYLASPEPKSEKAFKEAVERMKISTRQYAKRQVSWIRNKLLPAIDAANRQFPASVPTYLLDATHIEDHWDDYVEEPATQILRDFLAQRAMLDPSTLSSVASKLLKVDDKPIDPSSTLQRFRKMVCPTCTHDPNQPFMVNEGQEWEAHKRTRMHRRSATEKRG